jgi:hypothetical protein
MSSSEVVDLRPFRTAEKLVWRRHTVWAPHRGDDGNLVAGDVSMPLDTWLPGRFTADSITENGVGIAIADPESLEGTHDAIRRWCRQFLGRDNVEFEPASQVRYYRRQSGSVAGWMYYRQRAGEVFEVWHPTIDKWTESAGSDVEKLRELWGSETVVEEITANDLPEGAAEIEPTPTARYYQRSVDGSRPNWAEYYRQREGESLEVWYARSNRWTESAADDVDELRGLWKGETVVEEIPADELPEGVAR